MPFKAAEGPSLVVVSTLTVLVLRDSILCAAVMRFLNGFMKAPFSGRYNQSRVKLRKLREARRRKCFHSVWPIHCCPVLRPHNPNQISLHMSISCFDRKRVFESRADLHKNGGIWNAACNYLLVRACLHFRVKCLSGFGLVIFILILRSK